MFRSVQGTREVVRGRDAVWVEASSQGLEVVYLVLDPLTRVEGGLDVGLPYDEREDGEGEED